MLFDFRGLACHRYHLSYSVDETAGDDEEEEEEEEVRINLIKATNVVGVVEDNFISSALGKSFLVSAR